jgi:hypothetical protein
MDEQIVRLYCQDCECTNCTCGPRWYPYDGEAGCTRKVPEELAIEYFHYTNEVMPFLYLDTKREYQTREYKNYIALLDKLYSAPLGQKFKR